MAEALEKRSLEAQVQAEETPRQSMVVALRPASSTEGPLARIARSAFRSA